MNLSHIIYFLDFTHFLNKFIYPRGFMVEIFTHKSVSRKYYYVRYSGELCVHELDLVLSRFLIDFINCTDVLYIAEFTENSFITDKNFVKRGIRIGETMVPFLKESYTIGLNGTLKSLFKEYIRGITQFNLKRTFYTSREDFQKINVLSLTDDFTLIDQFPKKTAKLFT
jgi:hypothetical protein